MTLRSRDERRTQNRRTKDIMEALHSAPLAELDHDVLRAVLRVLANKWEQQAAKHELTARELGIGLKLRDCAAELRGVLDA